MVASTDPGDSVYGSPAVATKVVSPNITSRNLAEEPVPMENISVPAESAAPALPAPPSTAAGVAESAPKAVHSTIPRKHPTPVQARKVTNRLAGTCSGQRLTIRKAFSATAATGSGKSRMPRAIATCNRPGLNPVQKNLSDWSDPYMKHPAGQVIGAVTDVQSETAYLKADPPEKPARLR